MSYFSQGWSQTTRIPTSTQLCELLVAIVSDFSHAADSPGCDLALKSQESCRNLCSFSGISVTVSKVSQSRSQKYFWGKSVTFWLNNSTLCAWCETAATDMIKSEHQQVPQTPTHKTTFRTVSSWGMWVMKPTSTVLLMKEFTAGGGLSLETVSMSDCSTLFSRQNK